MSEDGHGEDRGDASTAWLAFAIALPVPILVSLTGEGLGDVRALFWLLAILPPFLLGFRTGARGALLGGFIGFVALLLTEGVSILVMGREISGVLIAVAVTYVLLVFGIARVTQGLHEQRESVQGEALTDNLTGLPNRRHAEVYLQNGFAEARRGNAVTVVLFDLDGFKSFNDLHGHRAGDRALKRFGKLLAETTRKMDLSARFGGEEFLSILPHSDEEGGLRFAERVRSALQDVQLPEGSLTVSAGVATFHPSMRGADELIAAADLALYRAKRDGRNCVRVFGRALRRRSDPVKEPAVKSEPLRSSGPYPRDVSMIGREPPPAELLPSDENGFGAGRSIGHVDLEPAELSTVQEYLVSEGFEVAQAGDTSDLEPPSREFDAIILGVRADRVPRDEWVATLKSRWPATQVVLSYSPDATDAAQAVLHAGADRSLPRPFSTLDLRAHLVDALARRDHLHAEWTGAQGTDGAHQSAASRASILAGARALVRAVEVRDPHKRGHARRVAEFAEAILRASRIPPDVVDPDSLRLACELHDIGEIGVPGEIFNKREPLTTSEFQAIRRHPEIGVKLLEPLMDNETVLGVVRSHHERWDGSGYPDGLTGEAIPVAARIVGLAETLDAMTSSRPHRDGGNWQQAVDQIVILGETQFDPELMGAFQLAARELEDLGASRAGASRAGAGSRG